MSGMRTELDRALARDLAALKAASVAARERYEAAATYYEAALVEHTKAQSAYAHALAQALRAVERETRP